MISRVIILLCASIACLVGSAFAEDASYTSIIQKQSKKIQALADKVSELEEAVKKITKDNDILDSSDIKKIDKDINELDELSYDLVDLQENLTPFEEKDKSAYDMALATLKEGNYDDAEKQFAEFIDKYPLSRLQYNATFWRAESFYRRGVFDKAAIYYLRSYKKYPKSPKAPNALLKLAYSLAGLDKKEEACGILQKLDLEFPDRAIDSIKRAQEAKENLLCK